MSVNIIPERDSNGVAIVYSAPYAVKSNATHKFFKRVHGENNIIEPLGATGNIELIIPYNLAKIAHMEILNCSIKDKVSVKFYDTPSGTISGTPNAILNQFGYGVEVTNDLYRFKSEYDADLIKDMKISIEYTNNGLNDRYIGVNFILDELVPYIP